MEQEKQRIIRVNQVRGLLGDISIRTVYRYVETGILKKPFKIGGVNGWYEKDIQDTIAKLGLAPEEVANG